MVGASAGLGRATALRLARARARIALGARRADALEKVANEAGPGAIAVSCDVRDPASCEHAVAAAVEAFGGLDGLVFCPGVARPRLLAEADAEEWQRVLGTNVIGASLITRAAIPHLSESRGRAVYLSSIIVDDQVPRRAMALYATSKAALNKLIEAWQGEHPEVAFVRLQVGDTFGTEFGRGWSDEEMSYVQDWVRAGVMFGRAMDPDDVAEQVAWCLAAREALPVVVLQPRPALECEHGTRDRVTGSPERQAGTSIGNAMQRRRG